MEYETLPKDYWGKHDYLLYIYDILGDMLRQADHKKLSEIKIKFGDDNDKAESFQKADDIFIWMDDNGYHDKSLRLFTSHVFFMLLRDFCYYIYESISCAERGKVTVAYTLLRKPVRDNLLYMEWLLSNNEEFYQTFLHKEIEEYDVSNWNVFTSSRIKKIIKLASQKTYMGHSLNVNNLLYKFRFDSQEEIGLQRIWNQSMHLVTKSTNYKTEKTNLNFIFADKEIWNDYWNYYYLVLPNLMTYVLEVCEALFLSITTVDEINLSLNRSIRYAKYSKVYPKIDELKQLKDSPYEICKIFEKSNLRPNFQCKNCSKDIILNKEILTQMINSWYVICPVCNQENNICKYYTDFKYMEVSID